MPKKAEEFSPAFKSYYHHEIKAKPASVNNAAQTPP